MEIVEALHKRGVRAVFDICHDFQLGPLNGFNYRLFWHQWLLRGIGMDLGDATVCLFPLRNGGYVYSSLTHFGTLKIAMRLDPILMVSSRVPTNTRFRPLTLASRQPVPLVIFSPLRGFLPLIVISLAPI
jgi:hypothetical protein